LGAVNPVTFASRLAPRHCGQSSPRAAGASTRAETTSAGRRRRRTGCVMVELLGRGPGFKPAGGRPLLEPGPGEPAPRLALVLLQEENPAPLPVLAHYV